MATEKVTIPIKPKNRVLYVKHGRAPWKPVISIDVNSPVANELIISHKTAVLAECLRGGACIPEFKDVIEQEGREI